MYRSFFCLSTKKQPFALLFVHMAQTDSIYLGKITALRWKSGMLHKVRALALSVTAYAVPPLTKGEALAMR